MSAYRYFELTSDELRERIKSSDFVILPVGSIEQHSYHLPVGTDILIAEKLAEAIVKEAPKHGLSVLLMPPIYYGFSEEHIEFPGTISIKPDVFIDYVYNVCASLAKNGAKRIFIVNGHGGNLSALDIVSRRIGTDFGIFVFIFFPMIKEAGKLLESEMGGIGHAGEVETSLMLYLYPGLVRKERMKKFLPKQLDSIGTDGRKRTTVRFGWFRLKETLTDYGVIGDPTKATKEKGEKIFQMIVDTAIKSLIELKTLKNLK